MYLRVSISSNTDFKYHRHTVTVVTIFSLSFKLHLTNPTSAAGTYKNGISKMLKTKRNSKHPNFKFIYERVAVFAACVCFVCLCVLDTSRARGRVALQIQLNI